MPLPKIKGSGVTNNTKEDENNSLDTFIKQAIGKEPFLSFSRVNESPVPFIQLLHALDQQDLPGWPLLSPLKIQMQKCDKCCREFCSTINYRRHLRLHRRNLNLDKDSSTKIRGLLQEFWDKLCVEKTMEIMSLEDVSLDGVTGNSIVKKLASFIRKPGFTSLPQSYLRAGSALLDIIQAKASRFPVSSQELFGMLDEASEKTFLCAGTAESLHKYVFDGEASKNGLEVRNSIACTSFLLEQKLVKACLADKDAEALRYQKLLVQEEEAAHKRQAAVLERKRQKKLRQKEQKMKEQVNAETSYPEYTSPSPSSSTLVNPNSNLESSENPCIPNLEGRCSEEHETRYPNVGHKSYRSGRRRVNSHWHAPKFQKIANGYYRSHNYHVKLGPTQNHVLYRDGGKVWTPKTKAETDEVRYTNRLQVQVESLPCQDNKSEVLIGSISVTLGNQSGRKSVGNVGRALDSVPTKNSCHEKPNKIEAHEVNLVCCNDSAENTCTTHEECCSSYVNGELESGFNFSSLDAEAFLAKRWKEAISSDHVTLVLCSEVQENHLTANTTSESSIISIPKIRPKLDKVSKVKYIPKQRSIT